MLQEEPEEVETEEELVAESGELVSTARSSLGRSPSSWCRVTWRRVARSGASVGQTGDGAPVGLAGGRAPVGQGCWWAATVERWAARQER